ncbi:MAG: LysR family transcriptional regulator, partial [Eubacteriaceae bacterium]|nr:LysR family transcriptional regulator [Eubacteriaceae bacterium]
MELRQLQYFIAVAEELNFTNAAIKLHMAQQPVSIQIKKLEEELGVRLFDRTTRFVSLTPVGNAFYNDVKNIFKNLDEAVDHVKQINKGKTQKIVLGYESAMLCTILPPVLKRMHKSFPEIKLELIEMDSNEIYAKLKKDEIDLGLMSIDVNYQEYPDLQWQPLGKDRAVIAMADDHPYAKKEEISLSTLANEDFILIKESIKPYFYRKFINLCKDAGFLPVIVQEVSTEQSLMTLISRGIGISLVFNCLKYFFTDSIAYVPLKDPV